ncbi:efflux RND transporter periplasmic adaptor subunit [Iodobacter arcticus]|uniref:Efflux RND transporter periplasmic adaptor subunit n=1 Tax=Iodobacter arcticus TaxID=590593 RepID=A0ABW2QS71_9NEIS
MTVFKKRSIGLGVLFLVLAIGGVAFTQGKGKADKSEDHKAPRKLEFAAADLAVASLRPLDQSILINGALQAVNYAALRSKVSAQVDSVLVREGEEVKAGQILARFDASNIAAQLNERQSNLEMAKAELGLAEKTHGKNLTLQKQGFISGNAFDSSSSSLTVSQAKLKAMQAQVAVAKNAMDDMVLRAPIGGQISKRSIQPGEKVDQNSELFNIVDLSAMELQVAVPASQIAHVAAGQQAEFQVDGFNGKVFNGTVQRINPEVEKNSRAITVFIAVKNPNGALRGGMFAKGQLALGQSQPKLTIPNSAVQGGTTDPYVYSLENGKIAQSKVKLGSSDERSGLIEITAGLNAGAKVLARKMDGIKPGMVATAVGG